MGIKMGEDDIFIGSFLELMNLRFAPTQGTGDDWNGGIDEIAALQREFGIFKKGRPFHASVAAMNLGGFWNVRTKNKWLANLKDFAKWESDKSGENGDERIVNALIGNLGAARPLPVYFTTHDGRDRNLGPRILVGQQARPLFYMDQDYLTISLPTRPRRQTSRRQARAPTTPTPTPARTRRQTRS